MFPELTMGVPDTVRVDDTTPTLVTPAPLPLPPVLVIVTAPLLLSIAIPVPAIMLVTPVFNMSTVPKFALAVTLMPTFPVKVL